MDEQPDRLTEILESIRGFQRELTKLVVAVAELRAKPSASRLRTAPDPRPMSVTPGTAAKMLDLHYDTVRKMLIRGVFSVLATRGRGRGKRIYLHTDEVEKYGETRDELAVKQLRQDKGRLPVGLEGRRRRKT